MAFKHTSVLLKETVDGLNVRPDGTYVDVTFGGGGHSREIIRHLGPEGRLLAFDQDLDAQQYSLDDDRFTFIHSNFRFLKNFLRYYQAEHIDGLLADLGVSFHHFDEAERGFSFRFDGALDMRMNQQSPLTAATLLNSYDEERLSDIFYLYGELPQARKLANAIVKSRQMNPLQTINNLLEVVRPYINRKQEKKELAQLFQALRIEVNAEMESLRKMLRQALDVLNPGGRLVVLTYHSLEDRLVKNFFKTGNFEGKADKDFFGKITTPFKLINRKVIVPTEDEIERNPRSRSAKLRIAEKL